MCKLFVIVIDLQSIAVKSNRQINSQVASVILLYYVIIHSTYVLWVIYVCIDTQISVNCKKLTLAELIFNYWRNILIYLPMIILMMSYR